MDLPFGTDRDPAARLIMKGPERIETARLVLRRPLRGDADGVFTRFASDPEVTRFMGWPRHQTIDDTHTFLTFSDAEWERWPAGPYLIEFKADSRLLGSTGLCFETETIASTGYVLAKDAWGVGYATEALAAMVELARQTGVLTLWAACHHLHVRSARVLEKCGFAYDGLRAGLAKFPNFNPGQDEDCRCYSRDFPGPGEVSGRQ